MAVGVPPEYQAAIAEFASIADKEARKYGETGRSLLAKLLAGESGFRMEAVSSAGARGAAQFMPQTRAGFIDRYGVDPWKSPRDAVHGAALFLRDTGFAGYNPGGGQGYISYILGQQVTGVPQGRAPARGGSSSNRAASVSPTAAPAGDVIDDDRRSTLLRVLLTIALVLGGLIVAGFGTARAVGLRKAAV